MSKPELLAPAGGMEQLRYALHFGADAVYCASDRFGLRQRAENISLETMPSAVALAHEAGAKLFVACNAYLHDEDVKLLPSYLEGWDQAGVDALIVSDLAVVRLAKRYAPRLPLHISTQASCSNTEAALAWYELGARRIVCAREMSREAIAHMRQNIPSDLELEVFVHGAMCMAISGRCLISDYLTGRSANRGHCAQPCRWEYTLQEPSRPGEQFSLEEDERGTYIMNSKDMCMLEHLDDLIAAGIDSFKIEGRNKKAFYVATVVNAYRQVLDGADPALLLPELETISHRPYATGFFYGSAVQTSDNSAYAQTYDWVGEVLTYDKTGRVYLACRNRFYEGDVLEVLSPYCPIKKIPVVDLRREYSEGASESVQTASQAMETYSFVVQEPLSPHDILRVKRKNSAQKN